MLSAELTAPIDALRRALVEGGGKGVSLLDPQGKILRAGPGLGETLGAPQEELIGAPLQRFLPGLVERLPDLLEQSRNSGWAALWGEETIAGRRVAVSIAPVSPAPSRPGSICDQENDVWVHTCGRQDPGGRRMCGPCSFALFVRDETIVTEPLERVVHQFEMLRSFLSGSGDPVMLLDKRMRIFGWNRAAEHTFGYSEHEVQGMPLETLLPQRLRDAGEIDVLRRQLMRVGTIRGYETMRVTREGEERAIELTLSCLRDGSGECVGFSAIHRDITLRQQLQERVIRDGQLAAIGRMAAQVAHELRNPLGAIQLNVEMARDELVELPDSKVAEARKLLDSVLNEVDLLARIVNEYLQFSRMPSSAPEAIELEELASEAADLLGGEFASAGVRLSLEGASSPGALCSGDRDQLHRVILNLLRNALEATPRGRNVDMRVATRENEAQLQVSDEGCGIPGERLDWAFEPFHTTKTNGTGLGLPLARKIVEEHGGRLTARARRGAGMVFEISLPISEQELET